MKAVVISKDGGPDVLKIQDRPNPIPTEGEVLVRVHAFGINRPDVAQREGNYPAPLGAPKDIPGLEVAGEIISLGMDVDQWKVGDQVCALLAGGGYAEQVNVPVDQCLPIPIGLSFEEAAALPETLFTVWTNVFDRAEFKKGEKVLIHGGSSGIGVAAIQMIKAKGGHVAVTVGSEEKRQFTKDLGADLLINYKNQDFEQEIKDAFGGVDIILDMVGGNYTSKNVRILNEEGRIVIINAMSGRLGEVDLMRVMVKRLIITGSTLRARDASFKGAIAKNLEKHIWPLIESGKIRPIVNRVYNFADIQEAHRFLESGKNVGKIVIKVLY